MQLGVFSSVALANSDVLTVDGHVPIEEVVRKFDYYLENGRSKTVEQMLGGESGLFKPLNKNIVDFGYTKQMIWLRLRLKNEHPSQSDWRLYFHENFKQFFEVHLRRADGSIDVLLMQDVRSPFSTRPVAFPQLVAPFQLDPGENADVIVVFRSEGSSHLPVSIETAEGFAGLAAAKTAKNFLFFGMTMLLIVGAIIATAIFRYWIFPAYAAYASTTLVFIMHNDGVAFQYLWPMFPLFNGWASIPIGACIPVFGAIFAILFLQTHKFHKHVHRLLLMAIIVPIILVLWSFFGDNQFVKKALIMVTFCSLVLFAGAGIVAARKRFKQVRFYLLAWTVASLSGLLMVARHYFGIEVSQDFHYDTMRIVVVFDAAMMGFAIADQYSQMRTSRQLALKDSLNEANRSLELNQRLDHLERQYALAEELARSRDEELSNTVHDLRQPLNALRLNVQSIISTQMDSKTSGNPQEGVDGEVIDKTFMYLEDLVSQQLQPSVPSGNPVLVTQPRGGPVRRDSTDNEIVSVDVRDVLKNIHHMFLADAQAKGLSFELGLTSNEAEYPKHVKPLDLMRLVNNLVANAIKYTASGTICLSARAKDENFLIEVSDTGAGLTPADFLKAQERSVRLDGAETTLGSGFGLAIAHDVAAKNGWTLEVIEKSSVGSSILVSIPVPARAVLSK